MNCRSGVSIVMAGVLAAAMVLADTGREASSSTFETEYSSLEEIRRLAKRGDAEAQFQLGFMVAQGKDVPQDDAEAAKWTLKAAEQGHAAAQYVPGAMLGHGRGVPHDIVMATNWLRKAAEQGHVRAQVDLGLMLADGLGVQKDLVESLKWFFLAAEAWDQQEQGWPLMAGQNLRHYKILEKLGAGGMCDEPPISDQDAHRTATGSSRYLFSGLRHFGSR